MKLTEDERISATKMIGKLEDEYNIYRNCADNGKGGDITRKGEPLLTYEQWLKGN
jgi:CTP-dependent riboflavin kinase